MSHDIHFNARVQDWGSIVEIAMRIPGMDRRSPPSYPKIEWHTVEDVNAMYPAPSDSVLTMTTASAQSLMDKLWDCGLRPSEGSGSAGSLRATENHLDDMRKIVFNYLLTPKVTVANK